MMPRKRLSSFWVALAFGLNIAGLIGLLGVVLLYIEKGNVFAAEPVPTAAQPAIGISPTALFSYFVPSVTPNPRTTPYEALVATPTVFALPSGRTSTIIGLSVEGRPLEVYTFGQGESQRMIVAGIHGGYEGNTIRLADQLILYLDDHPEAVPSGVTLYILRSLNPDGDARSHDKYGRTNANGVDLNRNFPVHWLAEWKRDGCWDELPTTGGSGPGSEPETKALMRFLSAHKIEALISYHSAALGIFPGGEPWDEDSMKLAQAIAEVSGYPYPPIDTGCVYSGTLADYAVALGAAAVDMELANHHDTDYEINLPVLKVLLNWTR
jgi:predicted deacylase